MTCTWTLLAQKKILWPAKSWILMRRYSVCRTWKTAYPYLFRKSKKTSLLIVSHLLSLVERVSREAPRPVRFCFTYFCLHLAKKQCRNDSFQIQNMNKKIVTRRFLLIFMKCQSLIQTREHLSHQLRMKLPQSRLTMHMKHTRMTTLAMIPLRNSVNPRKWFFASVIRRIPVNTLSLLVKEEKILRNISTVSFVEFYGPCFSGMAPFSFVTGALWPQ